MSFCGECGNKITPESTFCQECGTKVDNSIIIDDISNEIDTQNEIEEPDTSSKQVLNYSQLESKTNFGSELSSIPSKIESLAKYVKGYSYVLMLIYAATSIVLISSIIHIIVNIGVIAVIFNFVRYLESNFEKSKKYFNGLFAIMIYQIFDSLSIESDLSLTVNFLSYFFGGFFTFIVFFLIPVIIVSILNSKHLEQNTLSLVDVPNNNNKSIDKITKIPNYDQLVELKSMKKLQKTNPLKIVQIINYLLILGIFGFGGLIVLLLWAFGGGGIFTTIMITAMLIFIMLWLIKGLDQYKKGVRLFYSVFVVIEILNWLFWIYEIDDDIFSMLFIFVPLFQIYTLFIHKPTSDYFQL